MVEITCVCLLLVVIFVGTSVDTVHSSVASEFDLYMPNVAPQQQDTYYCVSVTLDIDPELYITKFEPHAEAETAHHMLLFGCNECGHEEGHVWNCGDTHMSSDADLDVTESPESTDVCSNGDGRLLYAWALNAPSLILPKVHMETACCYHEEQVLHPFAIMTRTHSRGLAVSGFRIRSGEWLKIGRKNPHLPLTFYPFQNQDFTIRQDDILAAKCTTVTTSDQNVFTGSTMAGETCNFYFMFYTLSQNPLESSKCYKPPGYKWADDPNVPSHIDTEITVPTEKYQM
ncbi:putative peptidylglycine alpha-hydroxylating monooxygenase 1 [Glandiceps talaboti]